MTKLLVNLGIAPQLARLFVLLGIIWLILKIIPYLFIVIIYVLTIIQSVVDKFL